MPTALRPRRHPMPCTQPLVAILLAMLIGASARAQTMPLVPDPITTPELGRYAELLNLSDQQRLGVMDLHQAYMERYREFQAKDVQKYLDRLIDIGLRFERGKFDIPERKTLEDLIDDYKKLLTGAQGLDRSFFNNMSVALSEDQLARLQRARNRREIAAYRVLVAEMARGMNPGAGVSMIDMLSRIELSPEEASLADQALAEYEASLLGKTREIFIVLTKAATVLLDTIDQMGLRDMTPEQMMAMVQDEKTIVSLQGTFDEASKPFQAAAFEMSQLNLRTFRRIEPTLSPEHAERFRERFYDAAYDDAWDGRAKWLYRYDGALLLDELTPPKIDEIKAQRGVFLGEDNSAVDSVVNDLDDSRKYRTFAQLSQRESSPLADKIAALHLRRESITNSANGTLDGIIGPDLAANLDDRIKAKRKDIKEKKAAEMAAQAAAEGRIEAVAKPADKSGDAFLPDPLTVTQLQAIGESLGFTESDRAVLVSVFDDYRAEYQALLGRPLVAATQPDAKPTSAEECKAKRERFDALAALDASFFENAAALAKDERQQAILTWQSQVRRREVLNRAAQLVARTYQEGDQLADPVQALLAAASGTQFPLDSVQAAIAEYETNVAAPLSDRLNSSYEAYRQDAAARAMKDRDNKKAMSLVNEKRFDAQKQVWSLNADIGRLNQKLLADIIDRLPAEPAWSVRATFNRTAYPDLFRPEQEMSAMITRALGLPDLTADQRSRIEAIAGDFRTAYFGMCDQIISHRQARDRGSGRNGMPSRDEINREINSQRLDFDRTEACSRARMQMRLVLRPEQVQALPGLLKER